jgi:hypothetical protein
VIPHLRKAFNAAWSEESYRNYCARLEEVCRTKIEFRIGETPIFLPRPFLDAMVRSGSELVEQLQAPAHQEFSRLAVPKQFDVPNCPELPLFAQVDFAITRGGPGGNGDVEPRLIELQAFPSLYGFQYAQAIEAQKLFPGGERMQFLLSGLSNDGYRNILRDAILGGHPAENVVLLDIDPHHQKTRPDFYVTEDITGIRSIDPREVEMHGREMWYERDGKKQRILRIYNRVIVDELERKKIEMPFRYTDELAVEWAGHPNFYFRWSKHSLPKLRHWTAPEAHFLSDLKQWPDDLSQWVYKPLFSFAGVGVQVDVTKEFLDSIPDEQRGDSILMKKVDYAPVIETVDGNRSKAEIRIMFIWRNGVAVPVNTLVRLSQGKMMGVDFNKNRTWVGSSTSFWE